MEDNTVKLLIKPETNSREAESRLRNCKYCKQL